MDRVLVRYSVPVCAAGPANSYTGNVSHNMWGDPLSDLVAAASSSSVPRP